MKKNKGLFWVSKRLAVMILVFVMIGGAVVQTTTTSRMDGFTNDPNISAEAYAANPNGQPDIFKMHLAGPGLTTWDYSTGRNINVAILDGSFNMNDPELKANVKGTYNAITKQEGNVYVQGDNHGTSCAKILGAVGNNSFQSAGVAYNVNLYLIRVDANGTYTSYWNSFIEGINYAIQKKCRVISVSLSDPQYNENVEQAINDAYSRTQNSILFVASGGNTNTEEYRYPSSYTDVFGVSAVNYVSGQYVIGGSTRNDRLDIAAPSGTTSAATAYAAGVAALVFGADPTLTAAQCAQILRETATDAGAPGYDTSYGHGIINPLAAVQRAKLKQTSISRSISGVASSYSKNLSAETFQLNPSTEGSGVFTYSSSNPSVAAVDKSGKITLKKAGTTTITVSIGLSGIYQPASVKTKLTVTGTASSNAAASDKNHSSSAKVNGLKKGKITKLKAGKKSLTVCWEREKNADGYQVQIARNKKFTKGKKTLFINKNKKTKKIFRKLKKNQKYYVKVRAFTKSSAIKKYGKFSKVKSIKVK